MVSPEIVSRCLPFEVRLCNHVSQAWTCFWSRLSYIVNAWVLSTNHRRIAVMYFIFVITAACAGLLLATLIRVELALPGISVVENNAERYLTIISLHGLVMVFFVVIPVIFGAFGNFLLPTQLGVRDVAFPRLNSFMFWVTPSSFVLLLHIFFFDKEPGTPTARLLKATSHEHTKNLGQYGLYRAVITHETRESIWQKLRILGPTIRIEIVEWWFTRWFSDEAKHRGPSVLGAVWAKLTSPKEAASWASRAIVMAWDKFVAQEIILGAPKTIAYSLYFLIETPFGFEAIAGFIGFIIMLLRDDLGGTSVWYRIRRTWYQFRYISRILRSGPHPHAPFFMLRFHLRKNPGSFYWLWGPSYEAEYGITGITEALYKLHCSFMAIPPVVYGTPIADIRARQRGALYSVIFDPVTPANVAVPLLRPLYMKVSSWVSNQLIPGWAFITPYASRTRFAAVGKVDIALVVVFAVGLGSVFSALNYVITYRCVSAPQFKNRRELRSFYVDALLVGSRMMLAANPALLIAIWLMLSDRHLGTSYFDFSGGGDVVLFQHLFWFFGHPEVYIIIIPCFGFVNSLMPHFLRKRLSGRLALQFSMYTIAFMGFAVWGHHMYMVGLANTTRTLYSTMTVMISVPASTKVLHWCVTLVNSAPQWDVSFLFLLAFTYFFTLGGLSGMFNAHIGFDVALHDTFYVIGHFHVMLAGAATSCVFAAFYFYFAAIFGIRYSRVFAYLHFAFYFFGQALTLIPMFWLGYSGMPRRILDYPAYFGGWHSIVSSGHILSVMGFVFFLAMLVDSFYEGAAPHSMALGVARLNTRFAFYAYERRRVAQSSKLAAPLCRGSSSLDFVHLEPGMVRYVFEARGHAVSGRLRP